MKPSIDTHDGNRWDLGGPGFCAYDPMGWENEDETELEDEQ